MLPGDVTNIPDFVEAPSPEELRRRMLSNNVKNGMMYRYFDIQKDGNRWIAFYYKKLDKTEGQSLGNQQELKRQRA